jgi:broad specificity polyphosphatase/5'/3'-nucleotidase SurE
MNEPNMLVITKEEYLEFLANRLRLRGSCQREIENINFPFLFASGSEMLRTFILGSTEFTSTLPDRYKLPDRGFLWFLFTQAVKEIQVMPDKMVIKYELQEEYRKPFKQFYL